MLYCILYIISSFLNTRAQHHYNKTFEILMMGSGRRFIFLFCFVLFCMEEEEGGGGSRRAQQQKTTEEEEEERKKKK